MWGLPQKKNARRAYKIRLCGHLRRYKKIVKKTYIIYENYLSNSLSSDDYNIYGTLVKKKAVCQGYALTFMYLMKRQNIVCGYVSSEAANHAWNAVYLNNQWYHMDATWDDPTWDNLGRVKHTYFMISDATLLSLDSDRTDYVTSVPYGYTYTKAFGKMAYMTKATAPIAFA